jgi:DNA (cytosine-5)-methyltransferase 1
MKTLALCSGYGGLELGLEFAGWEPELVAYAEKDLHASKVMARHWPDVPNMGDLTEIVDPPAVDLVTAGFPCQPV